MTTRAPGSSGGNARPYLLTNVTVFAADERSLDPHCPLRFEFRDHERVTATATIQP